MPEQYTNPYLQAYQQRRSTAMYSNQERYRHIYLTTHVERVRKAKVIASSEAWNEFNLAREREDYLDRLIQQERQYIRSMQEGLDQYMADLNRARTSEEKALATSAHDDRLKHLVDLAKADADESNTSATNRIRAAELVKSEFSVPGEIRSEYAGALGDVSKKVSTVTEPGGVDQAIRDAAADPFMRVAFAKMTDNQKRTAAQELANNILLATKNIVNPELRPTADQVKARVAFELGLKPDAEYMDPNALKADEQAYAEDLYSRASGSRRKIEEVFELLKGEVEGERKAAEATVAVEKAEEATSAAQDLVADAQAWEHIRRDLSDDAEINASVPLPPGENLQDLQARYREARATASSLDPRDQRYFDDLFLSRVAEIGEAKGRIGRMEEERAGYRAVGLPTEELVRQRAAGIYAPERRRPMLQSKKGKRRFDEETRAIQERSQLPDVRQRQAVKADFKAKFDALKDDQKIVVQQAMRAQRALKTGERMGGKEAQRAEELYEQYKVESLPKSDLVKQATDLSQGDKDKRDRIIQYFMMLDMQALEAEKYQAE